jgi:hypothetical protein
MDADETSKLVSESEERSVDFFQLFKQHTGVAPAGLMSLMN